MNALQEMQTQAAQCFRFACESGSEQDQRLFLGMRNAWLALAEQSRQMREGREQETVRQKAAGAVTRKRAPAKRATPLRSRRKPVKAVGAKGRRAA